jgi:hypothetical protein
MNAFLTVLIIIILLEPNKSLQNFIYKVHNKNSVQGK